MKGEKTDTAKLGTSLALKLDREKAHKTPENIVPTIPGAYLRTKTKGRLVYYYLVKNYWDGVKPMQKVLRYYGVRPPRGANKLSIKTNVVY